MKKDPLFLAIDFGTQSVRAILFDLYGAQHGSAAVKIPEPQAPHPGWAEQDANQLWQWLCQASNQAVAQLTDPGQIKAVAVTTMRATVVPIGADGMALRPAITWPDQRRTSNVPPIAGWNGLMLTMAGVQKTIRYFQSEAETNWLAVHEPALWNNTRRYLLLSGFCNFRLTGSYRDSSAAQVAYVPFDFKRRCWAKDSSWKWQALPWLKPGQLPDLVPPGGRIGLVTDAAAKATGIPPGIPVIAAAADKACEALGAGASKAGLACLSFGTAATVNVSTARYRETRPMIPPYPAARPDRWNLEVQVSRGFWLVNWFKKEFGDAELGLANSMGVSPESLLDQLLDESGPGAGGLIAQPYWSPGLKFPGPEARGAVIGFSSATRRADIYRALLEGIIYALREGKELIEKRLGQAISQIRVTGGGSRSDAVMQLTADIFGIEIARSHTAESTALGAAINAAVGLGYYADYDKAVAQMTRAGSSFQPDKSVSAVYESLYQESYLPLYSRLTPVYKALLRQSRPVR